MFTSANRNIVIVKKNWRSRNATICIHCDRVTVARGLCHGCYETYRRLIARGEVTDEQLTGLELMKPLLPKASVIRRIETSRKASTNPAILALKFAVLYGN